MIMQEDVETMLRKSQSEDFSKPMCRACDQGKLPIRHRDVLPQNIRHRRWRQNRSFAEEIGNEEPNIPRPLSKPTHEIWIPMRAKWNINTDRIALFYQLLLQVSANTVEHLKLNRIIRQTHFFSVMFCEVDPLFIV